MWIIDYTFDYYYFLYMVVEGKKGHIKTVFEIESENRIVRMV